MVRNSVTCGVSSRYGEAGSVWRIASIACVVLGSSVKHIENSDVRPLWSIRVILAKETAKGLLIHRAHIWLVLAHHDRGSYNYH